MLNNICTDVCAGKWGQFRTKYWGALLAHSCKLTVQTDRQTDRQA